MTSGSGIPVYWSIISSPTPISSPVSIMRPSKSAMPMGRIVSVISCPEIGLGCRRYVFTIIYLKSTHWASRTSLPKILKRTARSFAPSFSVAIKRQYLLLQDTTNIGQSTSQSGTYTTASDEHIATALSSLASLLSLKVSLSLLFRCTFISHS